MPFTFFAHQAPVLPLKARWPRHVSGLGLVLGSMAPDFGYFLIGVQATRDWHRAHGAVLYCLPVAMLLFLLVTRLIAAPFARHVPPLGALRLRDWAYLEAQPRTLRHLAVVAASILFGVATHLAWDLFTHDGSWMGNYLPFLDAHLVHVRGHGVRGSNVLWVLSTILGGAYAVHFIRLAGRERLLRRWAEARLAGSTDAIQPDAPAALSGTSFWAPVVLATIVGGIAGYLTRPPDFHWDEKATWIVIFLRTTSMGGLGLAISAWRERRAWRHRSSDAGRAEQSPRVHSAA
jgi:Domain of unknown function (DUF4184)